ncbi:hypothetical protein BST11_09930 [Mycobacterium alsense]|uniref:DUF5642 family protein n=1 Tax=Mycobacterium alsense TaxID=324058 RepID=A0AA42BZJ7_9MYCO|nr:DUF5642 family protein [Mycobacterium alsense]MCV7379812.1 DUF5642 family protein [Mycobacterium alsense]OQZ91183.1 hypothetical protein BST11_09930 [Mycobacterium alsense]
MLKLVFAIASVCMLASCSSNADSSLAKGDISKVGQLKSTFGSEFKVIEVTKRPIDPKLASPHQLPAGLTFEPPQCAKAALGQDIPSDLKGSMAAISAEGNGNRFVIIAIETSKPLPFDTPQQQCKKVAFAGDKIRGGIGVVDAPKIDGARTLGTHRIMQADVEDSTRTGELYDYVAQFGDFQVTVVANPLVDPDQSVVPVDTQRARDLLVKAVAAVRS